MSDLLLTKIGDRTIDRSDPWADDVFERREHGERLERLIRNTPGAFVIALKAPWGAGKSVFLRRLEAHLEAAENPVPVVRIDAWRNDFLPDPLAVLTTALNERLTRDPLPRLKKSASALGSKIARVGAKLLPTTVQVAASALTGGASQIIVALADATKLTGEALLKQEADHRASAAEFRRLLSDAVVQLRQPAADSTVRPSPLVILIDELDRCRPDFAVSMLERVKHFFAVEGCVFLIATDGGNLPAAIQSRYGTNVDGERYLRRFFDLEYWLPEPTAEQMAIRFFAEMRLLPGEEKLREIRRKMADGRNLQAAKKDVDAVECLEAFIQFAPRLGLSLRDCAQALTVLAALLRSKRDEEEVLPTPLVLTILLRYAAPNEFDALLKPAGSLSRMLQGEGPRVVLDSGSERLPLRNLLGLTSGRIKHAQQLFREHGADSGEDRVHRIRQRLDARSRDDTYNSPVVDDYIRLPSSSSADAYVRRLATAVGAFAGGKVQATGAGD